MKEVVSKFGRKYRNPYQRKIYRSALHWAAFLFGFYKEPSYQQVEVPSDFCYPCQKKENPDSKEAVSWINHSTFLIEGKDCTILTDPIWSERCSPLPLVGPKRKHSPGISLEDLPPIDIVLISHNHYDHLDRKTVLTLHRRNKDIFWMVPKGVKGWFEKNKIYRVVEFEWWQEVTLSLKNVKITFVPAQHHSGRFLHDSNKSLWGGFVVEFLENRRKIYFAGDTGYNPVHFREIGDHFKGMDLSLIPIGAYSPTKFMKAVHISPAQAVHIHRDVRSKTSIGGHFHTFKLSQEKEGQAIFDLYRAMEEAELDHNTFFVLQPGQKTSW